MMPVVMVMVVMTFRPLQRSTRQIPQNQLAVLAYAGKALCPAVAAPGIERQPSEEGGMPFAACYYALFERRPDTC
jgi:hypothetical protein